MDGASAGLARDGLYSFPSTLYSKKKHTSSRASGAVTSALACSTPSVAETYDGDATLLDDLDGSGPPARHPSQPRSAVNQRGGGDSHAPTYPTSQSPRTVEDAIAYFLSHGSSHPTASKFMYLKHRYGPTSDVFRPYDLVVVPPSDVGEARSSDLRGLLPL